MSVLGIAIALRSELITIGKPSIRQSVVTPVGERELVILSGIGPARARSAGRRLIEQGAGALLSWGTAAALTPELRPGSIVAPLTVIAADGARIAVDAQWHARVCARLRRHEVTHVATVAETETVLTDSAAKRRLAGQLGAAAADMESAALGKLAQDHGIPFLVLRAVADDSATALPAWLPAILDEVGRPSATALCAGLMRHPADVKCLAQLARSFRAANTSLRRVRAHVGAQFLLAG